MMKVLLAVCEPRDATVAEKFLESVRLPARSSVTILHIVAFPHVAPTFPHYVQVRAAWRNEAIAYGKHIVDSLADRCREKGLLVHSLVAEGIPRLELVKAIRRFHIELAILGPHRFSRFARLFLGSVSEYVLSKAPCSVLIARSQRGTTSTRRPRVIFATDFSREAEAAGTWLRRLELPRASQITVVHVDEPAEEVIARFIAKGRYDLHQALLQALDTRRQELVRRLDGEVKRLAREGWNVQPLLRKGNPAEQVLTLTSKQSADLLVLGSRGVTGLRRLLLGSVAQKVVRHAPCSAVIVKRPS